MTSLSVLVNAPGFGDGAGHLVSHPLRRSVGLHFNLTAGSPVSPPDRVLTLLGDDGRFARLGVLAARALTGRLRADDIGIEFRAQLSRLRATGLTVNHLDSHRHVHALPGIWGPVRRAAADEGIRWVRRPVEPAWLPGRAGSLKRLVIGATWRVAARREGAPPSAEVRGIGLDGGRLFADELLRLLDTLPTGVTEVVLHPGRAEPGIAAFDPYVSGRDAELAVLLAPSLRGRLERGDLRLTDFGSAPEPQ